MKPDETAKKTSASAAICQVSVAKAIGSNSAMRAISSPTITRLRERPAKSASASGEMPT
ncbi:hypothetical protein [Ponticoccus litoralis]|uniref:Uncharacterized protein n=1 Tax=Ponticoccus litoralis TaxID=422297 RepID=A0AAW9SHB9_9RHOB